MARKRHENRFIRNSSSNHVSKWPLPNINSRFRSETVFIEYFPDYLSGIFEKCMKMRKKLQSRHGRRKAGILFFHPPHPQPLPRSTSLQICVIKLSAHNWINFLLINALYNHIEYFPSAPFSSFVFSPRPPLPRPHST